MEERLQLALLDNENSTQFRWLKYISKQYRRQHLQDITDPVLLQILALTHSNGHPVANAAKLRVLESIIIDAVAGGHVHSLEVFEQSEIPFEYRHMLLKLTPLEQDLSQVYFEALFEVAEKYWSPDPRMWAQLLGLIVDSKLAREFIAKVYTLPIPDTVKDITKVLEDFIVLNEALEPLSVDLCEAYYLPLIDVISRLDLSLFSLFARSLQRKQTALKLARLLFTLARMLKYPDHAQDYEHFCSFNELISFGEDCVMDVPSTIDYKLRTGKYEFRRILEGTEISARQYLRLAGSSAAHCFMGNVYLLQDNYKSAISEYLAAIKTSSDSPMLVKRLCVCLWKCGAEFESLVLAHLCDKDFTVAKVRGKLASIAVDPALVRLMCETEFIEAAWEVCKERPETRRKLLALLETPERHQSVRDNSLLKKQVSAQFFDLLRVALRFAKGDK